LQVRGGTTRRVRTPELPPPGAGFRTATWGRVPHRHLGLLQGLKVLRVEGKAKCAVVHERGGSLKPVPEYPGALDEPVAQEGKLRAPVHLVEGVGGKGVEDRDRIGSGGLRRPATFTVPAAEKEKRREHEEGLNEPTRAVVADGPHLHSLTSSPGRPRPRPWQPGACSPAERPAVLPTPPPPPSPPDPPGPG